jgi:hypothetical protein
LNIYTTLERALHPETSYTERNEQSIELVQQRYWQTACA